MVPGNSPGVRFIPPVCDYIFICVRILVSGNVFIPDCFSFLQQQVRGIYFHSPMKGIRKTWEEFIISLNNFSKNQTRKGVENYDD